MSWQDREYAKGAGRGGFSPARSGIGLSRGGSVVTTLIVINFVIFFVGQFFPGIDALLFNYGSLRAQAVMHGMVWQLVTAQYLHANLVHVAFNMIGLHFLGRSLEAMWSPRRFLAVYTMCGLAGNVFFVVLGLCGVLSPMIPAVGASGCIFGLLGIVAVRFPQATVYVYFLFPIRIRTAAVIFGIIALLTIWQRGANYGGEACHLAGLIFGVWWAMRGERWWDRSGFRFPQFGARLRRSGGTAFEQRLDERRTDAETIDRILRKVYEGGIHSLSESEKLALREATERQQSRERQFDHL